MTTPLAAARSRFTPIALRFTVGALAGLLFWVALRPLLPHLPLWLRFASAWLAFSAGPGLVLGARLTHRLDALHRAIVCLGLGSAALPLVVELLGRIGQLRLFPFIAFAMLGAGAAHYRSAPDAPRVSRYELGACLAIVLLALSIGSVVFAHRLVETPEGLAIYGDYDSFDLSFYAAWASEATHTVPPQASYFSGHRVHGAYYPQLVLAMVHRFADVPLLQIYFAYSWPAFLAIGALSLYALVRVLAPVGAATLAAVLLIVGGDFSYLAAWLLPHDTRLWDYVLWPTNFLSPTMEVLHFNTWAPTLAVFFTALQALARAVLMASRGWLVVSALLTAILFQFKPFAYIVLIAGVCGALAFSGRDRAIRRWLGGMILLTGAFSVPLTIDILRLGPEDQRSRLVLEFFVLPLRMLAKLNLTEQFEQMAARISPVEAMRQPILLVAATALFLLVGVGVRWIGTPLIWRSISGRMTSDPAAWRILSWVVVAGVAIPFVVATEPYNDTLQFYQTGLYVWWIFTAAALWSFAARYPRGGALAIAAAIAAAVPSSMHYVARKWQDHERPALARLSRSEMSIARYLQSEDARETVILHDQPRSPSLLAVASNRRVVLGWGREQYAAGSRRRARRVDRFFRSAGADPRETLETLQRLRVTHVLVRRRNQVHPLVLQQLTPLLTFPDVSLYSAPRSSSAAEERLESVP